MSWFGAIAVVSDLSSSEVGVGNSSAISSPMSDHVDALSSLHREDEIATSLTLIGGDEELLDRHAEDTKY